VFIKKDEYMKMKNELKELETYKGKLEELESYKNKLIYDLACLRFEKEGIAKDNIRLLDENAKLIEWIDKMINDVGICETGVRDNIVIPIYKGNDNPACLSRGVSGRTVYLPSIAYTIMK